MVLKGIKKKKSLIAPHTRLQITINITCKTKEKPTEHDSIMMWAAYALEFLGFMRCSEFTVPSQDK